MSDTPWLTIIGVGEDGPDGLCSASREALARAEFVMGPARHMALLPDAGAERVIWPVPFADGVERLMARRGKATIVLASGDPFWFGAGTTLAKRLKRSEWRVLPGRSTFSLAAATMGWPLEQMICLGLHAAPLTRLRPHLSAGQRIIATLRDGDAVPALGQYLQDCGFGASSCTVLEALGGPRQRVTEARADAIADHTFNHPLCVAIEVMGTGEPMPRASGLADGWFEHDGQITKRPVRALTLSALAPRPHEHLWDIGGGSGSIGIEWLLSDPSLHATTFEPRADRVARIRANATNLGVDRLHVIEGKAPEALADLPPPDVVFVGGGLSPALLAHLEGLPEGTRLVVNSVTLESDALLTEVQARLGGQLMRIAISEVTDIGPKRGWRTAFPITQWSHVL
ncbi:MAG: precorrin-6y C5,15-methyltransferase (decarboxylating) subunit CbiE [Pseudomonadota bacterium]